MKHIASVLLFSTFLFINAQEHTHKNNVMRLQQSFERLKAVDNQINQRNYFQLFPNTFKSFERTFGFIDGKASPLYDGYEYVELFFNLNTIPESIQLKKWINIAIGGNWDADAVNYFQQHLQERVLANPDLTYQLLKELNDKQIKAFFYFFFDGIHPTFENIPSELAHYKDKNENVYYQMKSAHEKVLLNNVHN